MAEGCGFGESWNKPPDWLAYTGKKYRLMLVKLDGSPESPKHNYVFLGSHTEVQCLDTIHEGVVCGCTTVSNPFCKGALQMYIRLKDGSPSLEISCHSCAIQFFPKISLEYMKTFWAKYERWVAAGAMEPRDVPFFTPFITLPEHGGESIPVLEIPVRIKAIPVLLGLLPSEYSLQRSHAALTRRYADLIKLTKQDRDAISSHLGYRG
ncbi:MAG: hypothetical protein WCV85_04320 [Patescibacteria group bacterium]|jgi:hypothetical protein